MAKPPILKPKELIRLLEKNGYYLKRQSGSHMIMVNETKRKVIVVPYHSKDLKKGTMLAIMKRAGIKYEDG